MKLIAKITTLGLLLLLIQACDQLSSYSIDYPQNNATYVGTTDNPPPIDDGTTTPMQLQFKISYDAPPSGDVEIMLNGQKIGQHFQYGAGSAVADVNLFRQFIRQGKNTLSVDPLGLGPTVIFNADMHGPKIIIDRGEILPSGNEVELQGRVEDFSEAGTTLKVELSKLNGYDTAGRPQRQSVRAVLVDVNPADGSFCACGPEAIDVSGIVVADDPNTEGVNEQVSMLYSLTAEDRYGYQAVVEYLADSPVIGSFPVQGSVRVALGDTFIESMRPILANTLYNYFEKSPLDVRYIPKNDFGHARANDGQSNPWEDPKRDGNGNCPEGIVPSDGDPCWTDDGNDGLVMPGGINPLAVDIGLGNMPTMLNNFYMAKGDEGDMGNGVNPGRGTVLLNGLKIKKDNLLDVDLIITELIAELRIDGGWFLGNIDVGVYIKRLVVDSDIKVQAVDKDMTVNFQDNANFQIDGLRFTELKVFGIGLTGLGNAIVPVIEGLIADLLPGILNPIFEDNLEKIVLGGRLTQPESGTQFDMLLNIAQLKTGNPLGNSTGNPFDMLVELESITNLVTADDLVAPALGPIFYDDPINPSQVYNALGKTGTNMSVAVNSNLINQMLSVIYSTGISHFTSYNGTTYYGANNNIPEDVNNPGQSTAAEGDTRVRLWPNMAPRIDFSEQVQGLTKAYITYDSATLYSDKYEGGEWKTQISLNVSFDLGITIGDKDGVLQMGSAGPPTFTINSMENNTSFQVPQAMIQGVLDLALMIGGDALAGQVIPIDLGAIFAGAVNGMEVKFMSDQDNHTIADGNCVRIDDAGNAIYESGDTPGGDGEYDLICQTVNFFVSTDKVGTIGPQGRNLFFQMQARDPKIPPAPALPRLDLDGDGHLDYQDNCSVNNTDLADAIKEVKDNPSTYGVANYGNRQPDYFYNEGDEWLDGPNAGQAVPYESYGKPKPGVENGIKTVLNSIYANRMNLGGNPPTQADVDHYNTMRTGDSPVSGGGAHPWLAVLFKNPSQTNSDVGTINGNVINDGIGDLCEDDNDRDGIWATYNNNPSKNDNCPGIFNPAIGGVQKDSTGNGIGDECDILETYVILRSLGSRYTDVNNPDTPTSTKYMCLSHKYYSGVSVPWNAGVENSEDMSNTGSNGPTIEECNAFDPGQRWYIKEVPPGSYNGVVLDANRKEGMFQIFAGSDRSNENDWQLANYHRNSAEDDGHMRMVKMNDPSKLRQAKGSEVLDARWVLGIDPTVNRGSDFEEVQHPWVIRAGSKKAYDQFSCMFYNTDGWGPDFNPGVCTKTYKPSASQVVPDENDNDQTLSSKYFRWGVMIRGEQLWDGRR